MASTLGALHKPSAGAVLDALERDAQAIARRMALAARDEVGEYGAVADPAFAAEVLAHAVEHVRAFVRAGRLGRPPAGAELEFVRARGVRRARELMPLDALLEVYLIGQRTVWEAIVAAAGDSPEGMRTAQELTALTFRYTHAINVAIADAYLTESNALASEVERGRRDLLDRLLSGRAPAAEEQRRAEALGLRPDGDHAVVIATVSGEEERLTVRALATEMPFVVGHHGEVVGLAPVYVRRGPRELRAALERRAEVLGRTHGVQLRAGVSTVCSGLEEIARGYGEAQRALRERGGVVALEEIPLLDYLTTGADEAARKLVPAGLQSLSASLAATLQAYADCDLNVARTAERLGVHPNTVHYRLGRVRELSGNDPRRFSELVELVAALKML
jgi:hypothetical protein